MKEEIEEYGDPGITSADAPVPKWLIATYVIAPILGVISLCYFWNGSAGWLDRGYWGALQKAANTTFPQIEKAAPQFSDKGAPL